MGSNTTTAATAAELRASATAHASKAQESYERSDTDGALTQWAHGLFSSRDQLQAEILDNGGTCEYQALFDLDGNLVAAKRVDTRYGSSWAILASDDPNSRIVAWFNESKAKNEATRLRNNAKKGYYIGAVRAPARAEVWGNNVIAERLDGDFSRDVTIIDNGHEQPEAPETTEAAQEAPETQEEAPVAETTTIRIPGGFIDWFDGTSLAQKQDDADPECKSLRLAYEAGTVTRTGQGYYVTATVTRSNLLLLQEYAGYCLFANEDEPRESEIDGAETLIERVHAALARL